MSDATDDETQRKRIEGAMPNPPSEKVRREIVELQSVTISINREISGLILPADRRLRMALGCLDLAVEIQSGIAVLADQPLWGPAFALVRSLFESLIRGIWLARYASEDQLTWFQTGDLGNRKTFAELVTEVEKSLGHSGETLTRLRKSSWAILNDFTHSGFQHVVRRNSETSTGPNYPDQELIQMLRASASLGLLAAIEMMDLSNHHDVSARLLVEAKRFSATG